MPGKVAKKRTGPRKARSEKSSSSNCKDSNENNVVDESSRTSTEGGLSRGLRSVNSVRRTNGEGNEKNGESNETEKTNTEKAQDDDDDEIVAIPPPTPKEPVVYDLTDDEDDEEKETATKDNEENSNEGKPTEDPLTSQTSSKQTETFAGDKASEDKDEESPMIRISMDGIFEQNGDDEEENNTTDVQSMLNVEMIEGEMQKVVEPTPKTLPCIEIEEPRRPRRAAAQVAANTIKNLVTSLDFEKDFDKNDKNYVEEDDFGVPSTEDNDFPPPRASSLQAAIHTPQNEQYKCHVCSKFTICPIVVRRYGTDLHLCSNACFNTFRNPKAVLKVPVPCAQCGSVQNNNFYWETMNFCSDECVANYALTVGGKCSTCESYVPWTGIGKYCVRFGSDIRQFCTASCLESYKKSARVCFNCQLDIKQLKSVVIASIPPKAMAKPIAKEFCTQDCVEMYVETNMQRSVKSRRNPVVCVQCRASKPPFRDLILSTGKVKTCSEVCWKKFLYSKTIVKTTKCEMCPTYIPYENYSFECVANENVNVLFCAPTCKNVYVLSKREILSCTQCKVKKYNFDLIRNGQRRFAVCSLNCIPRPSEGIKEVRRKWENQDFRCPSPPMPTIQINSVSSLATSTPIPTTIPPPQLSTSSGTAPSDPTRVVDRPPKRVNQEKASDAVQEKISKTSQLPENTCTELKPLKEVTSAVTDDLSYFTVIKAMKGFEDDDEFNSSEAIIVIRPPSPVEHRNKVCSVRPRMKNASVSADLPDSGIRYVPVPFPVYIPVPFYPMSQPVPILMPFPIPIPVPLLCSKSPQEASSSTSVLNTENNENLTEPMDVDNRNEQSQTPELLNEPKEISSLPLSSESSLGGQDPQEGKSKTERWEFGLRAWKLYFGAEDPLKLSLDVLSEKLVTWVKKGKKPSGTRYRIDLIYFFVLGLQEYFEKNGRDDAFFYDPVFLPMIIAFTELAESTFSQGSKKIQLCEKNLWDSNQLGAKSPCVLLFTLIYFLSNYFQLTEWQDQSRLKFNQVIIDSDESSKYIRIEGGSDKTKDLKLREKNDSPDVCPVKLLETYIGKCMSKDGAFLKNPLESQGEFWFSRDNLEANSLYRMHVRASLIKN